MGAATLPTGARSAALGLGGGERSAPPVIIAGLDTLAGLQIARILGRRGIRIIGIARDLRHFSCYTRACDRVVGADTSGEELIAVLEQLAAGGDRGVVIPCTDQAVVALARGRERVESGHILPLADLKTLETLGNKAAFATYAVEQGFPVPQTIVLDQRADVERAARSLRFPCALKPAAKTDDWWLRVDSKAFRIESPDELLETYERVSGSADRLVAQEWIAGDGGRFYIFRGYFGRNGKSLTTFMSRKVRQWPLDTGIAVSTVECRNDVVDELALRLFEGIGYWGFGMLEVVRDPRSGEHLIIEANVGRPTAQTGIAERGGVELLLTAYCDAAGWTLPANREQRDIGVKSLFFRNDLRAALALGRQGRLGPRAWARSLRGPKTDVVFSLADPLPFLVDLLRVGSKLLPVRSRARRAGSAP